MSRDKKKLREQTKPVGEADFELPDDALEDVAGGIGRRDVTGGGSTAQKKEEKTYVELR